MEISNEYIKNVLSYSEKTGVFVWTEFAPYKVRGKVAGYLDKDFTGYVFIRLNNKLFKAHRLAWFFVFGSMPKGHIDHINGIRNDNRIGNLRDVSMVANIHNQRVSHKNNSSGLLGVSWYKPRQLWRARIVVNKKSKHLGLFESKQEAYNAYLVAKRNFHSDGCTI